MQVFSEKHKLYIFFLNANFIAKVSNIDGYHKYLFNGNLCLKNMSHKLHKFSQILFLGVIWVVFADTAKIKHQSYSLSVVTLVTLGNLKVNKIENK